MHFRNRIPRASRPRAVVFALLLALFWTVIVEACPTCKEGLVSDGSGANLVRGYGWSIIFMISVPFILFTSLCSYFYYEVVKARKIAEQAVETA